MQSVHKPLMGAVCAVACAWHCTVQADTPPAATAASAPAAPRTPPATFTFHSREQRLGSNIRETPITGSQLPFNKRWSALTTEQQAIVRSWYADLSPDDEPPFPMHGTRAIFDAVHMVVQNLAGSGRLTIFVTVEADGKASGVDILQAPSPDIARAVAVALVTEPYKPGRCKGQPCRMQFPLRVVINER